MKILIVILILFAVLCNFGHCGWVSAGREGSEDWDDNSRYVERDDGSDEEDYNSGTLKLVHVLFRHGDRSQIFPYANDSYKESDWPQGYGQLSMTGMEQAYELGQFFKDTYITDGFLSEAYNRTEVHVRSTDFDRTLMTAYSVLAGLFPPMGNQTWNKNIPWQPIPVHTTTQETDNLLNPWCPRYGEYVKSYKQNNTVIKQTLEQHKEFYEYVSQHSGEPATWEGIGRVIDPIWCQDHNDMKLPDWIKPDILSTLYELRDIYASVKIPPDYAYLRGGNLLGEIIEHMQNVSVGGSLTEKLFIYSAHDSTVQALLDTIGVYNGLHPPYTACVIIELYEDPPGNFYVSMAYRNESDDPYPLKLTGCGIDCPLQQFLHLMTPNVPTDLETECQILTTTSAGSFMSSNRTVATILVAILTLALLIVMVVGGIFCLMRKNKLSIGHDYSPVPMEMT